MYRRRNTSLSTNSRKVQFDEGGSLSATDTSFKLPNRGEVIQKGKTGSKKLVPLPHSPVPPPLDSPPFESEKDEDISLPSISDRRTSLVGGPCGKSLQSLWIPERRFSVSMPKEKKAELLSALKEGRIPQNYDRRMSLLSQVAVGSRQSSQPHDKASFSFSVEGSYSRESDDFVDNLTKQKMNLQLKSVTDRISGVREDSPIKAHSTTTHLSFLVGYR